MSCRRWHEYPKILYAYPVIYFYLGSIFIGMISIFIFLIAFLAGSTKMFIVFAALISASFALCFAGMYWDRNMSQHNRIYYRTREALFHSSFGNPLHLRDGDILPQIDVTAVANRTYQIRITIRSVPIETLQRVRDTISYAMTGEELSGYAVTDVLQDIAGNYVDFILEDVIYKRSHQYVFTSLEDYVAEQENDSDDSDSEN
jgi:hypothetical protein